MALGRALREQRGIGIHESIGNNTIQESKRCNNIGVEQFHSIIDEAQDCGFYTERQRFEISLERFQGRPRRHSGAWAAIAVFCYTVTDLERSRFEAKKFAKSAACEKELSVA